MTGYDLPYLNAVLNATATVLLTAGYVAIRTKRVRAHMALMLTAVATSALFLASYLTYHLWVARAESTVYRGQYRPLYLTILVSHIILAPLSAALVLVTLRLALKGRFRTHRRLARFVLPIWLYVSVTGVVIFFFLKDLYPTQ